MNVDNLLILLFKIVGLLPLDGHGKICKTSALIPVIFVVFGCILFLIRMIRMASISTALEVETIMFYVSIGMGFVQVIPSLIHLINFIKYRKTVKILLQDHSLKHQFFKRFKAVRLIIVLSSFSCFGTMVLSTLFTYYNQNRSSTFYKLVFVTQTFNSFQNLCLTLQFFCLIQNSLFHLQNETNYGVYRMIKFVEGVMSIFQLPLMIIYATATVYVTWYTYLYIDFMRCCNNDYREHIYYSSFLLLKTASLFLPCSAAQEINPSVSQFINISRPI